MPRGGRNGGVAASEKWRGGNSSNGGGNGGAQTQRPAKRPRAGKASAATRGGNKLKLIFAVAPLAGKILIVFVIAVLCMKAYRLAAAASLFQLRRVDVSGANRISNDEIQAIVRRSVGSAGVWRADLASVSNDVKRQQGWIREAVVTRTLPDGLRVRLQERTPRAVLRTASGRLMWVDDEGVMLGEVTPATTAQQQMPAFFIHGLDEANTDAARRDNRERMEKYAEMSRAWDASNLSERVSEVNLMDTHDVRAQLAGNDSKIEVRLGKENFGTRMTRALKVLDEQRNTTRGALITRLDTTLERKVVIGFSTGTQQEGKSSGQ